MALLMCSFSPSKIHEVKIDGCGAVGAVARQKVAAMSDGLGILKISFFWEDLFRTRAGVLLHRFSKSLKSHTVPWVEKPRQEQLCVVVFLEDHDSVTMCCSGRFGKCKYGGGRFMLASILGLDAATYIYLHLISVQNKHTNVT
jgi:hypothetical protein